jgi:hypothetical protein
MWVSLVRNRLCASYTEFSLSLWAHCYQQHGHALPMARAQASSRTPLVELSRCQSQRLRELLGA